MYGLSNGTTANNLSEAEGHFCSLKPS